MGWFDNVTSWVANPIGSAVGAITGNQQAATLANPVGAMTANALGAGNKTPAEQAALVGTSADRDKDWAAGYGKGKEIFYEDPDMKDLRQRREDLSKGYSGEELGALRGSARSEIAGQRESDARQLQSNLARQGVGGARAAAVMNAANQKGAEKVMDTERKMTLDNANLVRSGTNDLQDYIFRQKYGALGTAINEQQQGVNERTANQAAQANAQTGKKGILSNVFDGIF